MDHVEAVVVVVVAAAVGVGFEVVAVVTFLARQLLHEPWQTILAADEAVLPPGYPETKNDKQFDRFIFKNDLPVPYIIRGFSRLETSLLL